MSDTFKIGDTARVCIPHLDLDIGFTGVVISCAGSWILLRGKDGDNYEAFSEKCELVSPTIYKFEIGDKIVVHTAHSNVPVGFTGTVNSTSIAVLTARGKRPGDKYEFNYILSPELCELAPHVFTVGEIVYDRHSKREGTVVKFDAVGNALVRFKNEKNAWYSLKNIAPTFADVGASEMWGEYSKWAYGQLTNSNTSRTPIPCMQKEKTMSLTFETVAFVNGNRLNSYTPESLVKLIGDEESAIETLKNIKSVPKRVNDEIKRREKALRELIDFLDEHDADNTPT